jgi:hypothetical protein
MATAQVFNSFGCNGGNVSPALAWSDVPMGTLADAGDPEKAQLLGLYRR